LAGKSIYMRHMANVRRADFDHLLEDIEQRLARLNRMVRASRAAPATIDRVSDTMASLLTDVADRFRGRARAVSGEAAQFGEDALQVGNDALRKLTREVEQRPLVVLAIAVAVGALAAGILARR
jgi:ABC-type transporter Mla subunit MlaD